MDSIPTWQLPLLMDVAEKKKRKKTHKLLCSFWQMIEDIRVVVREKRGYIKIHSAWQIFFSFFFFFFLSFVFSGLHPPMAYGGSQARGPLERLLDRATAMQDLSSSRQCQILNPLKEVRDWTWNLMVPSWIRFFCTKTGTPKLSIKVRILQADESL